jgi:hypothetical protein
MSIYAKDQDSARRAAAMTREKLYWGIRVLPQGDWLYTADKGRIREDVLEFLEKGRSYEVKTFQVHW